MKNNVGSVDKMIRIVLAIVLFSMWFLLDGNGKYVALIGIIPLVTAFAGFCPLYRLFGVNTCKLK